MRNANPTAFPDLNTLLGEFVASAQGILGENFCGAYLVGSFALGAGDEWSDVDFLVVTHDEVSDAQLAGLRRMHARFPTLDIGWAQHLEGSYAPRAALRRVDQNHTLWWSWWYLDNGSTKMERSDHDNTAMTRWVLRESGIVLDGPAPATLVDPVSPDDLRAEARSKLAEWVDFLHTCGTTAENSWNAWLQPYAVLTLCRILYTLKAGRIGSKRAAGEWALSAIDSTWAPLIRRALDDRPDPWQRVHRPADPAAVADTLRFVDATAQYPNVT